MKMKDLNKTDVTRRKDILLGIPFKEIHKLIPGLILTIIIAWISIYLSKLIGIDLLGFSKSPISPVMLAILFGLLIGNLIPSGIWIKPGINFAVKKVLRLGIILLGVRLSIFEIFRLGAMGIPIVILCITGALIFTILINRWLKLPRRLGTLIAVGTSICGVSAIVATGPAINAEQEEVAYAMAVITLFGILATLTYPYLANLIFAGDPTKIGLFLGTSIHDTSQVTGASLVYADVYNKQEVVNAATVTKLVRNVFMVLVIPIMAFLYSKEKVKEKSNATAKQKKKIAVHKLFPMFIFGFILLAVLRSIGDAGVIANKKAFGLWNSKTWDNIYSFIKTWAVYLLVVALSGVGLNTRFKTISGLGWKPFIVGLGAAAVVGIISFTVITLIGAFIVL